MIENVIVGAFLVMVGYWIGHEHGRRCGKYEICDPKCECYIGGFDYGVAYSRQANLHRITPMPWAISQVREQTKDAKRGDPPMD